MNKFGYDHFVYDIAGVVIYGLDKAIPSLSGFITEVIITFLVVFLTLRYSSRCRNWWFSKIYKVFIYPFVEKGTKVYRERLFCSMKGQRSTDPSLNSLNSLRILEIGPAQGTNFPYFPKGSKVIAVDYNPNFESQFKTSSEKFSGQVEVEKYICASAEDMAQVPSNSVDAVVSTYVLCYIEDRQKALQEIKRVLVKGGVYYFIEHVAYPTDSFQHRLCYLMQVVLKPFWHAFLGGCNNVLTSHEDINNAGFDVTDFEIEFPKNQVVIVRPTIWGRAIK